MRYTYKSILSIVVPLIVSGFGQSIIYVTDILFLGRLGEVALGASAIAGLFYAALMMIGFGISSGIQVIIAQKIGEQKREESHLYLMNGIFLQILIAVGITFFYFPFHHVLIRWFVTNEQLNCAAIEFMDIRIMGLLPYFLFYAYRAYYLGIGQTKIISWVIIVMTVSNIVLNFLFIYGWKDVFSPMGYLGSAWASMLSEVLGVLLIMVVYSYRRRSLQFISIIRLKLCREISRLSYPLVFQHFTSVFSWFLFFVFIEKMGTKELAISNIVRAVYILIMSPLLAFSHSTVTITGQLFGAKAYNKLHHTVWRIVLLSALFTLFFSIICFFEPQWLMRLFTNDVGLIENGIAVMKIVSFALMYFAVSIPWLSAVTGIGKTSAAFFIELFSFVVYVITSYIMVFELKWSLPMVWLNEFVYFTCIGGLSYIVFLKSESYFRHQQIETH